MQIWNKRFTADHEKPI